MTWRHRAPTGRTSRGMRCRVAGALVGVALAGVTVAGPASARPAPTSARAAVDVVPTGPTGSTGPTAGPVAPPPRPAPVVTGRPGSGVPLPVGSGAGRRIVYSEMVPQHAWLVAADGSVVRDFPVSGRADWPRPGRYRVYSRSPYASNPGYGVTFRWMVRFTFGHRAAIGFHSIPRYYGGRPMQTEAQLGLPVGRGGCPHSADADAAFLYRWAALGTPVVVLR